MYIPGGSGIELRTDVDLYEQDTRPTSFLCCLLTLGVSWGTNAPEQKPHWELDLLISINEHSEY